MVELVTARNRQAHERLLESMYEDRKAVFVDLLKWDVPHDGRCERDQFDDTFADYLVVTDPGTSEHLASVRVLRSDRPHVLGTYFPELCDCDVPKGASIREISRLCLSPRARGADRLASRGLLATAMTEYALLFGISAYTLVTDVSRLGNLLSVGWRCEPLGMPRALGDTTVAALMIHIEADTIRRLRASGKYHTGALRIEEREDLAA